MTNQYEPPKTRLTETTEDPVLKKYSPEWKAAKSPLRPFPVVLIVVLYFVFSTLGAIGVFLEGGLWWVPYVVVTIFIAWLFRGLWWGDERERSIGVFCGFVFALFSWPFEVEEEAMTIFDHISMGESIYFILAALYLMSARGHRFFTASE